MNARANTVSIARIFVGDATLSAIGWAGIRLSPKSSDLNRSSSGRFGLCTRGASTDEEVCSRDRLYRQRRAGPGRSAAARCTTDEDSVSESDPKSRPEPPARREGEACAPLDLGGAVR
jgi:hypothetical protein